MKGETTMPEKGFNSPKAAQAQTHYCQQNDMPHFAPRGGRCWSCGHDIYTERQSKAWYTGQDGQPIYLTTGIDVEKASTKLVTGCPHCNKSYCD